jgi:hypothetical protein
MSFGVLLTASRDVRYATFGVPVTLPSAAVVTGIFSSPRALTELEKKRGGISPLELVIVQAKLELRDEDAVALEKGSVVDVGGKRYFLEDPIPDGEGETLFHMAPETEESAAPGGWR